MKRIALTTLVVLTLAGQATAAITFGAAGAVVVAADSVAPSYPASISAGNLLVYAAGFRGNSGVTISTAPAGFTLADSKFNSNTWAYLYYKIATGSESGTEAFDSSSTDVHSAQILRYANATGEWEVASADGAQTSASTSWSVTGDVDPGLTSGDWAFAVAAVEGQSGAGAISSQSMSATSATFTTHTERGDGNTNIGSDIAMSTSDHTVTAGTSSAAPVFTMTLGSARTGIVLFFRMREAAGGSSNGAAAYYYQMMQGVFLSRPKTTPLRVMTPEQLFAPLTGGLRYGH